MKKALIILLFTITAVALQWRHTINADEGVILSGAWNIYNGKAVYKDFFEFITPGSLYFAYAAIKFFGVSYYNILFASMLFQLASVYCVYLIFMKLTNKSGWGYISAYTWLIISSVSHPVINHNVYSSFLASFLLLLLLQYLEKKKNYLLALSGILSACIFYFLQTKGVAMFAATFLFLFYLFAKKRISIKPLAFFATAYAVTFFAGLFFWGRYVITNLIVSYAGYIKIATTPISYRAILIFSALCVFLFFIYLLKDKMDEKNLLCFFFQFALILSYANNPDKYHVGLNAFPIIILAAAHVGTFRFWTKYIATKIYATSATGIIMVTFLIFSAMQSLVVTISIEKFIKETKDMVGNENIYSYPFLPNMYFELQKPNPYYNDVLIENHSPMVFYEKNLTILKKEKPKFVILDYALVNKYYENHNNIIDNYIKENYQKTTSFSDVEIWEIRR